MSRLTPYLGIVLALLVGAVAALFSGEVMVVHAPVTHVATTTPSLSGIVLPPLTLPELTLPIKNEKISTNTVATATSQNVLKVPMKPEKSSVVSVAKSPEVMARTVVPAPSSPYSITSLDDSARSLRASLINIICQTPAGSNLKSISGSGIIIDAKGIILTNAHIAQYFLLLDRGVTCTVRSGSPATSTYSATLIYISPTWIRLNESIMTDRIPTGTGEFDFALLAITKSATNNPLPPSFPAVPLAKSSPTPGTPVVIASYGAQFLEISQIQSSLFPTIVFGSVKKVYTFNENSIDILALGGSAAAQEGSSGGGVTDVTGELVGTITTSTVVGATDTRSLNAITASYIRSEYMRETASSIDVLLNAPTVASIADFAPQIPVLEAILTKNLH